jgi:hypothetical protein
MTESSPFTLLSPLGLELTGLLQKKETSSAADGRDGGQKKRRMMNILQAIEHTPPALADKAAKPTKVEATVAAEDENLTTTLSKIDKLISDVVAEKEVVAAVSNKGKILKKPLQKE